MTKWQKKLTKKMRQHLKDTNATTLDAVRKNVEAQAENIFPCWECVEIGRRLGIEVEVTAFLEAR